MDKDYRAFLEDVGFRSKVKMGMTLGIVILLSFAILDYIVMPELFPVFLGLRLAATVVLIVCIALLGTPFGQRRAVLLGSVGFSACLGAIASMIQLMDPVLSTYYQGISAILVFMPTYFVWNRRASGFVCALAFFAYAVPTLLLRPLTPEIIKIFVNNAFFLGTIAIVVYFGSGILFDARFKEFITRRQLKAAHAEQAESNRRLRELDRQKTQFFANVSHELRTPLTLILAPLSGLLGEPDHTPLGNLRDLLNGMRRNSMKLLLRINEILDIAKLEAGKVRLRLEKIEAQSFLRGLIASVNPTALQRGLNLTFEASPEPINIHIDPEQFEKVILNLLSNAVKFTPQGGNIHLALIDETNHATISVSDTGEGIPSDLLAEIFDRFAQVDRSPTRRHEGTGLGLALTREIVELHGGTIWAESDGQSGSVFKVRLTKGDIKIPEERLERRREDRSVPHDRRASDDQTQNPGVTNVISDVRELHFVDFAPTMGPTKPSTDARHQHALLLVDDNPDVLALMSYLLKGEYNLLSALSAEEGLKILADKQPDLVLCDVMMPGMDGHEFCRRVKADTKLMHTPIILVTARADADALVEGFGAGADDFLAKPFDPAEVKARIRSLLRMTAAEAELAQSNANLRVRTEDLTKRQRELFLSTVKSLVSALDAKDNYTRNHSLRVTEYSLKIAGHMGLVERELKDLELASLLHDVGKIAVPESVLHKPGKLSDDEFAIIKAHPAKGEQIIAPVLELRSVGQIVRSHHERYDGKGYPDGLSMQSIPLGSRIMAVADTYDAMTSDRPYRQGLAHSTAVKEIVKFSGIQFDPEVVQSFLELAPKIREAAT